MKPAAPVIKTLPLKAILGANLKNNHEILKINAQYINKLFILK
jgi:hypothetical protein